MVEHGAHTQTQMSESIVTTAPLQAQQAANAKTTAVANDSAALHTLELRNVCQSFPLDDGRKLEVLKDVSFAITQPEIVGIVGPSGCGKSTLLRLISGLDMPAQGELLYDGAPITGPGPERGFVFQSPALCDWLTIKENIAIGLKTRKLYKENEAKVDSLIEKMGLSGFENSYPYQISGGMASRASLARTFVQEPGVVLLDEPLSALDAFTRALIQDQIVQMHLSTNALFVLVTHDIEEAVYLCDRILIMSSRPSTVVQEIHVDLPHPRDRVSDEFVTKRREVLKQFSCMTL
jgi:sulfonate transport system ATP-binding protein